MERHCEVSDVSSAAESTFEELDDLKTPPPSLMDAGRKSLSQPGLMRSFSPGAFPPARPVASMDSVRVPSKQGGYLAMEEDNKKKNDRIFGLNMEIMDLRYRIDELTELQDKQVRDILEEFITLKKSKRAVETEREQMENERKEHKEEVRKVERTIELQCTQIIQLKNELSAAETQLQNMKTNYDESDTESTFMTEDFKKMHEMALQLEDYENRENVLKRENSELEQKVASLMEELATASTNKPSESTFHIDSTTVAEKQRCAELEEKLAKERASLKSFEKIVETYHVQNEKLEAEMDALKATNADLEDQLRKIAAASPDADASTADKPIEEAVFGVIGQLERLKMQNRDLRAECMDMLGKPANESGASDINAKTAARPTQQHQMSATCHDGEDSLCDLDLSVQRLVHSLVNDGRLNRSVFDKIADRSHSMIQPNDQSYAAAASPARAFDRTAPLPEFSGLFTDLAPAMQHLDDLTMTIPQMRDAYVAMFNRLKSTAKLLIDIHSHFANDGQSPFADRIADMTLHINVEEAKKDDYVAKIEDAERSLHLIKEQTFAIYESHYNISLSRRLTCADLSANVLTGIEKSHREEPSLALQLQELEEEREKLRQELESVTANYSKQTALVEDVRAKYAEMAAQNGELADELQRAVDELQRVADERDNVIALKDSEIKRVHADWEHELERLAEIEQTRRQHTDELRQNVDDAKITIGHLQEELSAASAAREAAETQRNEMNKAHESVLDHLRTNESEMLLVVEKLKASEKNCAKLAQSLADMEDSTIQERQAAGRVQSDATDRLLPMTEASTLKERLVSVTSSASQTKYSAEGIAELEKELEAGRKVVSKYDEAMRQLAGDVAKLTKTDCPFEKNTQSTLPDVMSWIGEALEAGRKQNRDISCALRELNERHMKQLKTFEDALNWEFETKLIDDALYPADTIRQTVYRVVSNLTDVVHAMKKIGEMLPIGSSTLQAMLDKMRELRVALNQCLILLRTRGCPLADKPAGDENAGMVDEIASLRQTLDSIRKEYEELRRHPALHANADLQERINAELGKIYRVMMAAKGAAPLRATKKQ